ncbi:hypothetical protein AEAC466_04275 [Asticcacaulis sp. AC466]|uniref:hypothetical protein n=1 Tax=Asticcacaulis sp. AC466 TaxID=1282362 RepID=UPI0003C3D3EE|nr:hypothetical protein [Asticcacaulis sp. AC466]ESQ85390.1 hypothetical protein AEAC466_04275 [Asticcacaulis sp. AC466]
MSAALWTFVPNWKNSFSVTRKFSTDILTSENGQEQRRAIVTTPRRSYEFTLLEWGKAFQRLKHILQMRQNQPVIFPDSVRLTRLASDAVVNGAAISVTDVPRWLRAGATIVIGDRDTREAMQVLSVVGSSVNLTESLVFAHRQNERVYFGVTGLFDAQLSSTRHTNTVNETPIAFEQMPLSEAYVSPDTGDLTFNGREVFIHKPDRRVDPTVTSNHPVTRLDYGQGAIALKRLITWGIRTTQATYLKRTAADMQAIEDFFERQLGRQGEFYAPTWEEDLTLAAVTPPYGVNMIIEGRLVYDLYANNGVYRSLYVRLNDGRSAMKLIDSFGLSGANTVIQVTTGFPFELQPAAIDMICWMPVCRFATDAMTTEWITDQVAQTQLSFQTLPALSPEA